MKKYLLVTCLILMISVNSFSQSKCDKFCWLSRFTLIGGIVADGINSNIKVNSDHYIENNFLFRSGNRFSIPKYILINSAGFVVLEYLSHKKKGFRWLMLGIGAAKLVEVAIANR